MTIASILRGKGSSEVVTARTDMTVQHVVGLLRQHRIGAVLVMNGDEIAGVLSERDIVRGLHDQGAGVLDVPASAIMTSPVVTVAPDDSCVAAMALITERRIRHLPVVDHGRLIGLVSIGDLVKERIEEAEQEAELLKDYIKTA